ncbi:unnamed protein product [Arctogadus glacialis]
MRLEALSVVLMRLEALSVVLIRPEALSVVLIRLTAPLHNQWGWNLDFPPESEPAGPRVLTASESYPKQTHPSIGTAASGMPSANRQAFTRLRNT